ncbi:hypothetical protein SALBM311S_05508 [Streptomyces alboniger]
MSMALMRRCVRAENRFCERPETALLRLRDPRPGEPNHDLFLRGRTRSEEPGRLNGAVLYEGPGYPYAVEEHGGVVYGEVVTALPEAYGELLVALDRLEEYVPGDPRSLYERVEREVMARRRLGGPYRHGCTSPRPPWPHACAPGGR